MPPENLESFCHAHLVALSDRQVFTYHFRHEIIERHPRLPSQNIPRFARITKQRLNFGRPEVPRVDLHNDLT